MSSWIEKNDRPSEAMRTEYIKLLIDLDNTKVAVLETKKLLANYHQSLTKHFCSNCGYNSDEIFWRCHQCYQWETIQFRWKV